MGFLCVFFFVEHCTVVTTEGFLCQGNAAENLTVDHLSRMPATILAFRKELTRSLSKYLHVTKNIFYSFSFCPAG